MSDFTAKDLINHRTRFKPNKKRESLLDTTVSKLVGKDLACVGIILKLLFKE